MTRTAVVHTMVGMTTTNRHIRSVPDDLWRSVRVHAALEGISLREFVIRALERAVEEGETNAD